MLLPAPPRACPARCLSPGSVCAPSSRSGAPARPSYWSLPRLGRRAPPSAFPARANRRAHVPALASQVAWGAPGTATRLPHPPLPSRRPRRASLPSVAPEPQPGANERHTRGVETLGLDRQVGPGGAGQPPPPLPSTVQEPRRLGKQAPARSAPRHPWLSKGARSPRLPARPSSECPQAHRAPAHGGTQVWHRTAARSSAARHLLAAAGPPRARAPAPGPAARGARWDACRAAPSPAGGETGAAPPAPNGHRHRPGARARWGPERPTVPAHGRQAQACRPAAGVRRLAAGVGAWSPAHRGPAGGGGVLVPARCEGCKTFEARAPDKPHAPWRLVPGRRRSAKPLWKGGRSKPLTHDALSACSCAYLEPKTDGASADKGGGMD